MKSRDGRQLFSRNKVALLKKTPKDYFILPLTKFVSRKFQKLKQILWKSRDQVMIMHL